MVDSEFLIVDSYNIPWLVWIQMFVFFLLLLLVFVFGIASSSEIGDTSSDSFPSSSGSSLTQRFFSRDPISISRHGLGFSVNSSLIQSNQIGSSQGIKGEIRAAETRRVITRREEQEECSLEKDSSRGLHHPCNLFQLAGSAFLKCFGLDRSTEETEESLRTESKKQR